MRLMVVVVFERKEGRPRGGETLPDRRPALRPVEPAEVRPEFDTRCPEFVASGERR